MFIIGVTGSIGSGKSTVTRILADMAKIPVVDADKIARELVEPGRGALVSIVETFGSNMIDKKGNLRRKELGDLIFDNEHARKELNKIMFPLIRQCVIDRFNNYIRTNEKYVIYDAPLLFESGMENLVDYTVLVHAPYETQVERVSLRNNLTWTEAAARVDAQPPNEELLAKPIDYLIQNTSDYIALNSMVAGLWKNIQTKKS